MVKFRSLALALGLSTALVSGFASAQMTLRVANMGEPDTLDPQNMSGTWENRIAGDLFLGLTTEAADGTVIPGTAESWSISADGTVYTFKLRADATWSDGTPVTAEDFVFAYRRIMDPKRAAKYASLLYPIKGTEEVNSGKETDFTKIGAKAIDAKTLEITLKEPTPYFLELLTHYTSFPLPKHVVEKAGNDWVKPGTMVTNGAYMLSAYTPNDKVELVKNPKFYDAKNVKIEKVIFTGNEDRTEMEKRFRAGEMDLVTDINPARIDTLTRELPNELKIAPYLGLYYYTFNSASGPTKDPKVRKALSMVVDRDIITQKVAKAGEIPAFGIVPPGISNYGQALKADWADKPKAERVAMAKKLMEEAGYGPGKPMKLELSYNTSEGHKNIAIAVQSMWKQELGVEAELVNRDVKVHYNTLRDGNFQVGRAGWIADYNDPQNFLYLLETRTGSNNYGKFSNADYDKLMLEAGTTVDLKKRAEIMAKAERIGIDQDALMPIYFYVSKNLVSQKLKGFVSNTKDIHRSRWMEIVAN